jgi:hypothetical protein
MTDKEKIRAEIERRKKLHEKSLTNPIHEGFGLQKVIESKISELTYLLSFIDSMQKEHKECMYSKDNYTDEDRKALCDGCTEECRYSKLNTMLNDALSKETKESWNKRLGEEPSTSVWHDASEKPKMNSIIVMNNDQTTLSVEYVGQSLCGVERWAYIDDILKL